MSTHNIDFYEDLTKIIFQLSLDFIKYAPYLFFWVKSCFYLYRRTLNEPHLSLGSSTRSDTNQDG